MTYSQTPDNEPGKRIKHVTIKSTVEQLVFPADIKSKLRILQEWLFDICDNDGPAKPVTNFKFNFFHSSGEYTLYLIGINKYEEGKNHFITRIEFEPSNMYFKLSASEYKNLNNEQLKDKLTSQLKDFTNTEKFKASFLANANAIGFAGERIWSK